MRFGLLPPQWDRYWDETLEFTLLAEEMGYDSVWMFEHHGIRECYASPLLALAALAARTRRVRLGTCVLLLPLSHPVHVAEDASLLDVMSGGRLILGVGLGSSPVEYGHLGVSLRERASRMAEGIQVLKRLWTEEDVTHRGWHYAFEGLTVHPRPVQRPHPPLWVGAWAEAGIRRAARLADAWFPGPSAPLSYLRVGRRIYNEEKAGKQAGERPLAREVFCTESASLAREVWEFTTRWYVEKYFAWGHLARKELDAPRRPDGQVDEGRVGVDRFIVGDPRKVIDEVERYREALDLTHLVCRMHFPGMDADLTRESARRFAEKVIPHFR
ncbi:MAG: LLM class flavin-dependent oxidoreductase [Nitrospinota bacterium]